MQHKQDYFIFGEEILNPTAVSAWNPDAHDCNNAHFAITGESGSGKSWLLKEMIRYLSGRKKHIYVIDLHGDLKVDGIEENYIEFTARQSKHGINPFEFDISDARNGGVMVQVSAMVAMIKKAFLPSMGPKQEAVLKQLIIDSYRIKGINDDDEATWSNELPSMDTLIDLIADLIKYHSQNSASIPVLLSKMDAARRSLEELDYAGYFRKMIIEQGVNSGFSSSADAKRVNTVEKSDESDEVKNNELIVDDSKEISSYEEEIYTLQLSATLEGMDEIYELYGEAHAKKLSSKLKAIQKLYSESMFLMGRFRGYCMFGSHSEMFGVELHECIDPKNYEGKGVVDTLKTLQLYISDIQTSGIFSDVKPPVKAGLNRLDISGLTPEMQSFFVDAFANKIFYALKRRGEYDKQSDKSRGEKVSTYIIIDEGRSILPSDKERDSPTQILNRVMNELRKFGGGLGFVSQAPSHFSSSILSAYTKISLKMPENEKKRSMQLLGIKDESLYKLIERKHTALIGTGSTFKAIALPGYVRATGSNVPVNKDIQRNESSKKKYSFSE